MVRVGGRVSRGAGAVAEFFAALEALTYREMLDVAGMIGLQLEAREGVPETVSGAAGVAEVLADAAESWREAQAD